jgi:DNA-binding CsgD family transcriptional regulator
MNPSHPLTYVFAANSPPGSLDVEWIMVWCREVLRKSLCPRTGFPADPAQGSAVAGLAEFLARLDDRLRFRNDRLTRKLLAWGELLDIAGWCVALDRPGDGVWFSRNAELDLRQRRGTVPDSWVDLVGEIPDGSLHHRSEGVLIWSGRANDSAPTVPGHCLTRREAEVMSWLREGKTAPEIAIILGCAVRTVEKHLANLYRKLGVTNRAAVILKTGNPSS